MSIVRILRNSRSRSRSNERALARAVASAPTRASRDELLSLAARGR